MCMYPLQQGRVACSLWAYYLRGLRPYLTWLLALYKGPKTDFSSTKGPKMTLKAQDPILSDFLVLLRGPRLTLVL